jgi:DNA-binding SARP family transcriptional activator/pimeloyl-ACP methyl ester carboxylesterase
LWDQDAPAGAVRTVQVYVSRLRRALGDDGAVTSSPAGYRLRVRPGELDLQRFEGLVQEARRALAQRRAEQAAGLLGEALGLWRGPPLADLEFVPFAQTEIARLEEQRLAAVEARVEADLAAGRHGELVPELQRLIGEHPLRERLHAHLMLALYRSGRQADALAAYRHARQVLVDHLGIEPGAQLRDLERRILAQDQSLAVAPPPKAATRLVADAGPVDEEIRIIEANGEPVQCALSGDGPPLVIPCWWISDVVRELEWPALRQFIRELGRSHTVIRYNRPQGPGERGARLPRTLDGEARLLIDVLEQTTDPPARIFSISCGACAALTTTVERPDLVERLVLFSPLARGTDAATPEVRASILSLVRAHWGLGSSTLAQLVLPDATAGERSQFSRFQRSVASQEEAAQWLSFYYGADVMTQLNSITTPVLVLQRRGDRTVPIAHAADVAARIRGARFVALPGRDHFPWIGDATAVIEHAMSFFQGADDRAADRTARPAPPSLIYE